MQQAVQNNPSPLERHLTVSVPVALVEAEIETRLKNLARTVKMQGFRPGKVPLKMVERQFGFQVRQEVVSDAVQRSFVDAVKDRNYRVAGYPRFQPVQAGQGTDKIEFTATFEVYPEINLGDLAGSTLKRPVAKVGEENVEATLTTLRRQRAPFEDVDRAAAEGDLVNLDFEGLIDGAPFEGNNAQNFAIVLGEGRMLPDFEAAIYGIKKGEKKTFDLTFPADYAEAVRGKVAKFTVTANQVAEPKLPPLDAEFAKTLGVEDGDVSRLRREVRENVEKEVAKRVKALVKDQVMEALIASSTFDLPRALLENEIGRMQAQAVEDLKNRGMSPENLQLPPELFAERATRRVKLGLLVSELVKRNELTPKPEQVRKAVESHAESFEHPEQLVRWFYSEPQRLGEIEALVMEDNVVEWAQSKMKVVDEPTGFDELMGTKKKA
ncbi:trigger factor [Usitatibacter palustris]|uniref:Trigger factor n=1 Tax=Usitatibacter palustris TaxID=2732487 RepID=A0A6M4H8I8_9PROT|nr:trigger factor [Usitatibacter palustris]QJR15652.1 Trigger factor [Usitatibacter palustris]